MNVLACLQIASEERDAASLYRTEKSTFLQQFAVSLIKQKVHGRDVSRGECRWLTITQEDA
jgi:hypothetical protein